MNHSYVDPGLGCIGQSFVVPVSSTGQALAQPTAPAEPRECSFDHPSSRQHLKVVAVPGALDNLERPACQGPDPLDQLSSIASIGPDQPHAGKPPYQFIDDQLRSISILDIGRMHHHRQQQPHGIYNDVSLSTVDLLASVIATRPPFSVVLTDWLSMMAALGVGLLPSAFRTLGRRASWTRSHVPSCLHSRKYHHTVPQGGRSCGMARHVQPLRRTYTMPLTTSRRSTVRGLPPVLADGSREARTSHCSSVRSLGYGLRFIPPF